MHTIIYISELNTSSDIPKPNLVDICQTSAKNNKDKDITGVLLFHNNHFLQVLEGDEETLNTAIKKISLDIRHKNIDIIFNEFIEKRSYPNWQMQLFDISDISKLSSATLKKIKAIYSHNFQLNPKEFLFLVDSILNDEDFLYSLNS